MAKANIERAMQMLDPDNCAQVYELPNIMARETFHLDRDRIESFDDLMDLCKRYYLHHFHRVVAEATPSEEMLQGQVWQLLERHYQGGLEGAWTAASRGINGGLPGVLDAIRDYFIKDQQDKYFEYTLMESVDVMDLDDIKTLMTQYMQRYGRYIDGDNLPSPEYFVLKYRDVLKAHAKIVRNIRTNFAR